MVWNPYGMGAMAAAFPEASGFAFAAGLVAVFAPVCVFGMVFPPAKADARSPKVNGQLEHRRAGSRRSPPIFTLHGQRPFDPEKALGQTLPVSFWHLFPGNRTRVKQI
jgi:hypothetical protein